jgi:hypothetical protein
LVLVLVPVSLNLRVPKHARNFLTRLVTNSLSSGILFYQMISKRVCLSTYTNYSTDSDSTWLNIMHRELVHIKTFNDTSADKKHIRNFPKLMDPNCRSQWPLGLRRRSSAARLLRLRVRIPPGAWMFVRCEYCVLSGTGLCDGLIARPEESYRPWRVVVCDQETSKTRRLKPVTGL